MQFSEHKIIISNVFVFNKILSFLLIFYTLFIYPYLPLI